MKEKEKIMPPRPHTRTPSRRMTLGGAPSAAPTNRRMSMGPGAGIPASAAKVRRPPTGRQSMIPRMGGGRENAPPAAHGVAVPSTPRAAPASPRVPSSPGVLAPTAASSRRSMGGASISRRQSLGTTVTKLSEDPRPIHDKAFQLKAIKALLAFLKESNYPNAVNQRSLTKPSSKEFNQILSFMLRLTDRNFQVDSNMKFEDEVCLQFKCLGYPFTISKTSLAAAGSPHTWPTLLAALAWLSEHLSRMRLDRSDEYLLNEAQPFDSIEDVEKRTEKAFFEYLLLAYHAFMQGDAQQIGDLEMALQSRFDEDDKLIEAEVGRIDDLNSTILERLSMLQQDAGNLPEWQQKRDEYLVDLEQFQDLNKKMDDHKKSLQQKKEDLTKELGDNNHKLQRMNVHIKDLKRTIKTQELSASDVRMLEAEIKIATEAMQRLQVARETRQKEIRDSEKTLQTHLIACESVMDHLNSKLRDVESFGELSNHIKAFKLSLNQERLLDSDPVNAFGVDCKGALEPAISVATRDLQQLTAQTNEECQAAFNRFDESMCLNAEVLSVQKVLMDKIAKCEDTLESERITYESKLAVRERETEVLASKARRDPTALEEEMAIMERELAELEALRQKHDAENVQKKKAVMEEIESACKLMMEQENFLHVKMTDVEQYRTEKMAKAIKISSSKSNTSD